MKYFSKSFTLQEEHFLSLVNHFGTGLPIDKDSSRGVRGSTSFVMSSSMLNREIACFPFSFARFRSFAFREEIEHGLSSHQVD